MSDDAKSIIEAINKANESQLKMQDAYSKKLEEMSNRIHGLGTHINEMKLITQFAKKEFDDHKVNTKEAIENTKSLNSETVAIVKRQLTEKLAMQEKKTADTIDSVISQHNEKFDRLEVKFHAQHKTLETVLEQLHEIAPTALNLKKLGDSLLFAFAKWLLIGSIIAVVVMVYGKKLL